MANIFIVVTIKYTNCVQQKAAFGNGTAGKGFYAVEVLPHVELPCRLREMRNGRSQSEIAKELGVTYQLYQRLETPGKCNPILKTVEKLSTVFERLVKLVFCLTDPLIKAHKKRSMGGFNGKSNL